LLELFIAREEGRAISLVGICEASERDKSVVLRSLATLIEARLILRQSTPVAAGDVHLALSETALSRLSDYFNQVR
jgi:predicted transcriptional regulator